MKNKINTVIKLFITFLQISPITFGGGYAMLALIELKVVNQNKWLKKEDIVEIFTVAQSLPGAIAINSAIFIGYRVAGLVGALFSLLGILLPTLFIVLAVSFTYYLFIDNPVVQAAFHGIGAAIAALIVYAAFTIIRTIKLTFTSVMISLVSLSVLLIFPINPIFVLIGGSLVSLLIYQNKSIKEEVKHEHSGPSNVYYKDS